MSKKRLDDSWKGWVRENLDLKCHPEAIVRTLRDNGFSLQSIRETLGETFPASSRVVKQAEREEASEPDYEALCQPRLVRDETRPALIFQNQSGRVERVVTDKLQLYVMDSFLTEAECSGIVEIVNLHLRPSTVTVKNRDKYFRTSKTCHLDSLANPIVASIDKKICETLGIRREYSEPNQAQRYDVGQEFKKHTDFFEPGTPEYVEQASEKGNRTWTVMVYLNEGMAGGGTQFLAIDKTFFPKKGRALMWNNLNRDGSPNRATEHRGMPVTKGHKIIITKWFREKGTGPMFQDRWDAR